VGDAARANYKYVILEIVFNLPAKMFR
jgi:hypothetical protein